MSITGEHSNNVIDLVPTGSDPHGEELSVRMATGFAAYLRDEYGADQLQTIAGSVGLNPEDLNGNK